MGIYIKHSPTPSYFLTVCVQQRHDSLDCRLAVFYIFIAALAIVHCASEVTDSHCSSDSRSVVLSINSTKNDSGQLTDLFSARTEHSSALHSITMDLLHNITECDGRRVIHIQGSIQKGRDQFSRKEKLENGSGGDCTEGCGGRDEIKAEEEMNGTGNGCKLQLEANSTDEVGESEKGMVFHSRVGSNVIISNDGRTIEKKNIDEHGNGIAFTSRPLKNDELFEVILDRKRDRYVGSFGIGVLTVRPEDFEFTRLAYYSPHAWMYYHSDIYSNGTEKRFKYGVDLNKLPAGTRFGVMKKSSGDVHFFVNGADQGSAISGICGPVYGATDLWANADKITILKP